MSFYRKYRPQKFMDLVGQEHVTKTLTNALKQGKVSHGYLFSGPRGTGKTTVARLLAKAINCEKNQSSAISHQLSANYEPCNECSSCQEITSDQSLDVIEIDAASNRGIDEIRDLREKIKFAPSRAKHKVFIIDEVHMLTKEAFNALLKTLEEPPSHAIFIMATTELHKIPATILSRVQQFDFKRAGVENIISYLERIAKIEKIIIDPQALRLIAKSGEGSYRDATSILDQVASLGVEKITLKDVQEILGIAEERLVFQFLEFIAENDCQSALDLINQVFLEGIDLNEFNHNLVDCLRKMLIYKTNSELLTRVELTSEQQEKIRVLSSRFEQEKLLVMIKLFIKAAYDIKGAHLPQLPLELVVIEICENKKSKFKNQNLNIEEDDKNKSKDNSIADSQTTNERPAVLSNGISLQEKWSKIIGEIEPENRSLYLLLKESEPIEIKNNKLFLAVKFKFYAERIEDKKNYLLINQAIKNNFGVPYALEYVISPVATNTDNLAKDVLEVFETV